MTVLQEAIVWHQQGNFGRAAALYWELLEADQTNADAWHLMGVVASEQGRCDDALDFIQQAIRLRPDAALYHANLGLALGKMGRWSEATESYRTADTLDPHNARTLGKLGRALARIERPEEAIEVLRRACALASSDADLCNALGSALAAGGLWDEALVQFRRALTIEPGHEEARSNLRSVGEWWARRGEEASLRQDWPAAVEAFARAVNISPGAGLWHFNLGLALTAVRRLGEARAAYEASLAIVPDQPETWNNLGHVLLALGESGSALAAYRKAIKLNPKYVDAHYNLGVAMQELGQIGEARSAYETVLRLKPQHADSQNNLGGIALASEGPGAAIPLYRAAVESNPAHLDARWNLGLAHLTLGDYGEGWAGYETRLERPEFQARKFPYPRWNGQRLSGEYVHVWAEQGLGDTIQFARYLPLIEARGGRVVFQCQQRLTPLMSCAEGMEIRMYSDEFAARCAYHVPLLSLPRLFATEVETIPEPGPKYRIPETERQRWAQEMNDMPGLRVGLVWASNVANRAGQNRSMEKGELRPLGDLPGVSLVSLQRGPEPSNAGDFGWLRAVEGEHSTVLDTAAAMLALDLVVSVDTMTAHLAATLGRPTWILLPFAADWRWMRERRDSPWYPNARLFRQTQAGAWKDVVSAVASEMEHLAATACR